MVILQEYCVDKYWFNCHSEQIKNWNVDRNEARRKSDGELDREKN